MLRLLLMACVVALVTFQSHANSTAETEEMDFLDLVDGEGNPLIQCIGVDTVNSKARAKGLTLPALDYWSPEGHCFVKPALGDCNGVFKCKKQKTYQPHRSGRNLQANDTFSQER